MAFSCNGQELSLPLTLLKYDNRRCMKGCKHLTEILLFISFLIANRTSDVRSMLKFSNLYLHFAFKSGAEVGARFWRASSKNPSICLLFKRKIVSIF